MNTPPVFDECWTPEPAEPGSVPVPHPVERRVVTVVSDGQRISEEQRERVASWLQANGIDPDRVVRGRITVECQVRGSEEARHLIWFSEYYTDSEGNKVINERTLDEALTYERWVAQKVPLSNDPTWPGWDEHRARLKGGQQ
ncbi:hypothetical protein [Streptomyces sp. NPDC047939]|uniref:hypothetical protein n=1 Tax=Streptomyces sp. NPDC047939 TaxID=3155381 RepID=UPI00342500B8